jgi:trigger factor
VAEILEREGYKVKLRVEVPALDVNAAFDSVVGSYAKRIRVPGFRPGKAPMKVVEAQLNPAGVQEEVRERIFNDSLIKAAREHELAPVGVNMPELKPVRGQDVVYEVDIETYPEVGLPDWRSYSLEASAAPVTDETVAKALEDLRERYGELSSVLRPIEEKDQVFIETDDGGRFPVSMENAQPHVKEALLGKQAGDSTMVPVKDGDVVLREIPTKILEVKALQLPELDDEFAKTAGEENLEALRSKVRESLEAQFNNAAQNQRANELTEKLAQEIRAEIPPSMLNQEQSAMLDQLAKDLEEQKDSLSAFVQRKRDDGSLESFEAELKTEAEARIRRSLAREALAEHLGTELPDEEWKAFFSDLARSYRMSPAQLERELNRETLDRLRMQRLHDKAVFAALEVLKANA